MVRSVSAEEILRHAREAAATPNVREAVRDLAMHALRSRLLTASHIAVVARAVGRGIESSEVPPTAPVREARRGAWAGLEDAVGEALHAVEIAAREFAEGRAPLSREERERALAGIAQLERTLREGWEYPRPIPPAIQTRIVRVIELLRAAATDAPCPAGAREPGKDDAGMLSFVASGVLIGLSETRGTAPADRASA
jgi:hypothetical protein